MGLFDAFKKKADAPQKTFICARCKKEITDEESKWIENHRFCADCAASLNASEKVPKQEKNLVSNSATMQYSKGNEIFKQAQHKDNALNNPIKNESVIIYPISAAGVNPKNFYACENDYYYGVCGKGKKKEERLGPFSIVSAFDYADNVTWEFMDGTLILAGQGETIERGIGGFDGRNEYFAAAPYLPEYVRMNTEHLIVQEGITELDWILFNEFKKISTISFPRSLKEVRTKDFVEYHNFSHIHIKKLTVTERIHSKLLKFISADQVEFL